MRQLKRPPNRPSVCAFPALVHCNGHSPLTKQSKTWAFLAMIKCCSPQLELAACIISASVAVIPAVLSPPQGNDNVLFAIQHFAILIIEQISLQLRLSASLWCTTPHKQY